ncbi:MAG: cytochrome b5 domain-containing protein [Candidatus Levybacteria bacterium]|nr:cytochrome b5 domain-containing protein [Candidatus Levybacteria bacterium]
MLKKLLLFGIPLALIVIGIFFFMDNEQTKQSSPQVSKEVTPEPTVDISPTTSSKTYSADDVKEHGVKTDCWMIIDGKVYDVTDFIPQHPGGAIIAKGCGIDATTLFNERPDTQLGEHPQSARDQLEKFYIGDLKE